jgi:hypothetical protein
MFGFECLATPIRRSARVTEMDRTAIAQIAPADGSEMRVHSS